MAATSATLSPRLTGPGWTRRYPQQAPACGTYKGGVFVLAHDVAARQRTYQHVSAGMDFAGGGDCGGA